MKTRRASMSGWAWWVWAGGLLVGNLLFAQAAGAQPDSVPPPPPPLPVPSADVAGLIDKLGSSNEAESRAAENQLAQLPPARTTEALLAALKDERWEARAGSVRLLARTGDARVGKAIIPLLKDPVWAVREQAARALGSLRCTEALEPLIAAAGDADFIVRLAVLGALVNLRDARAIELFVKAARSDSPDLRGVGLSGLGALQDLDEKGIAAVVALLDRKDAGVRLQAVLVLGRRPEKAVRDALAKLRDDPEPRIRQHATLAGFRQDPEANYEAVLRMAVGENLDDAMAGYVVNCMRESGRLERDAVVLAVLLKRQNTSLRMAVAGALAECRDKRALEPMAEALAQEGQQFASTALARAMARVGGADAVEPLLKLLPTKPEAAAGLALTGDPRAVKPLVAELTQQAAGRREGAAQALRAFPGYDMVPAMIETLAGEQEANVRVALVFSLGYIGHPSALKPLQKALTEDPSEVVRSRAAEALAWLGGEEALNSLIEATTKDAWRAQHSAIFGLQVTQDERGLEAVFAASRSEQLFVVSAAVNAMDRMPVKKCVPALLEVMTRRAADGSRLAVHGGIRSVACRVLGNIGDKEAVPVLVDALGESAPNDALANEAAWALGMIGDKKAVKPLIEAMEKGTPRLRWAAMVALGRIGDKEALPAVVNSLGQPATWRERWWASSFVGNMGDPEIVPRLLATLKNPDATPHERSAAIIVLGRLKAASSAIEPLLAAMKDKDPMIACSAAAALGELGDKRAAEPLIAMAKEADPEFATAAAIGLGLLGDERAVEPLKALLKRRSAEMAEVHRSAADALGRLGKVPAIPALIVAARDPDSNVRERALWALGQFKDKNVLPALVEGLKDDFFRCRVTAIKGLLNQAPADAIEPLKMALRDPDWVVFHAAAQAAKEITGKDPRLTLGRPVELPAAKIAP